MKTNSYNANASAITALLDEYLNAIYYGDVAMLKSVFHASALISGDINGTPYFKSLDEYLLGVQNRISPSASGEYFQMKVVGVEIINSIAIAKVNVRMFKYNYFDLLSLFKVDEKWLIINKLLTHVD